MIIVLCPTKCKLSPTKIINWSDMWPVKKKYLFAALIYYRPKKKLGLFAKEERTEANNTWTPADLVLRNNELARRWICSVSNRMLQDTNTTNNLWFKKIWLPSPQKIKCPKIKMHTSGVKQSTCTCKITKGRFWAI